MTPFASNSMQSKEEESDDNLSFDGFGSDIERLSTTGAELSRDLHDYWFGKKCLGYLVAIGLVSNFAHSQEIENLDVSDRI